MIWRLLSTSATRAWLRPMVRKLTIGIISRHDDAVSTPSSVNMQEEESTTVRSILSCYLQEDSPRGRIGMYHRNRNTEIPLEIQNLNLLLYQIYEHVHMYVRSCRKYSKYGMYMYLVPYELVSL